MSGRIERKDGRLEHFAEDSYRHIIHLPTPKEVKKRKRRQRAWKVFLYLCWSGYCWLIVREIARHL